jgi:signal transduction histidine kinase
MQRIGFILWPAAFVLGLAAEWAGFGWSDPGGWVLDLIVGWFLIACGLIARQKRPATQAGNLMTATGFIWFLGNFANVDIELVSWAAATAVYLHRGPLFHLLLTYPTGRTTSRLTRGAVMVGYALALIPSLWRNDIATISISAALIAVSARDYAGTVGEARRACLFAFRATAAVGLVIGGTALFWLIVPEAEIRLSTILASKSTAILVYELTLIGVVGALFVGLFSTPWKRTGITDLVVELGEAREGTVRDELARALGDPSLEVGYRDPDSGSFTDAEGRPLSMPGGGDRRSKTEIEIDAEIVAVLIHDPAVLDDSALVRAVASATQLAASNVRLRSAVQARLSELRVSRRRILEARDEERRLLEHRLHDGAEQRLDRLGIILYTARSGGAWQSTSERIDRAETQLGLVLRELRELAHGLHPRVLSEDGLEKALTSLGENLAIPVEITVTPMRLPTDVEAACFFFCSEALANVVKHASASKVWISVDRVDERVTLTVEDDGVGGADPSLGSGLRGLSDRLQTVDGTLVITSERSVGTRLTAEIPLGDEDESAG